MPPNTPIDLAALAGGLLQDLRTLASVPAEGSPGEAPALEGVARVRTLASEIRQGQDEAAAATREVYAARAGAVSQMLEERQRRLTAYAVRERAMVPPVEGRFVVAGRITDAATGVGLPDVRVQAWDLDRRQDDFLGETRTDALGYYRVEFGPEQVNDPDGIPETYIVVFDDAGEELHRSTRSFIDKSGPAANISAAVDGRRVSESLERGTKVALSVNRQVETLEVRRQVAPPVVALPVARVEGVVAGARDVAAPAPGPVEVRPLGDVARTLRALAEVDRARVEAVAVPTPTPAPVRDPLVTPTPVPVRDTVVTLAPAPTPSREAVVPTPSPEPTRAPERAAGTVLPVTEVQGVGATYAGRLQEAGITDAGRLAALQPQRAAEILGTGVGRASAIVEAAGEVVRRGGTQR